MHVLVVPEASLRRMSLQRFVGAADTRYFSLGRFALAAGLRLLPLEPGALVLVPAFICRDLLGAIHLAGATPVFYPVNAQMMPAISSEDWPPAAAVLAVNYFGFPQNLEPFEAYCRRTGAVLIEDNAHGFLSRDAQGSFLGTRADMGIFSLRKTLPIPNGAALLVKKPDLASRLTPQLAFDTQSPHRVFRFKQWLANLPAIGVPAVKLAVAGLRCWRRVRTGQSIPTSGDEIEHSIPGDPRPHQRLRTALEHCDAERESLRRRNLYRAVEERLSKFGIQPVFPELAENTVPYGYPFFGSVTDGARVNRVLRGFNLECFTWPELPASVRQGEPTYYRHYHQVWWVNFLPVC